MFENAALSGLGAGIIVTLNNNVLLVQVNYGVAKGKWILPGGTVDKGEHPEQTAERELFEETGLTGKVTGLLAYRHRVHDKWGTDANVYFVFAGELDEDSKIDPESKFKWDPEELMSVKFWDMTRAIKDEDVAPTTRKIIEKYNNSNTLAKSIENQNAGKFEDSMFCL